MLDAVYVDTVEEKSIVAFRPKPAFRPLFEIATTREDSDVVLINEPPKASTEPEAADPRFWWRRGSGELHQKHGLAVLVAMRWTSVANRLPAHRPWQKWCLKARAFHPGVFPPGGSPQPPDTYGTSTESSPVPR